MNDRDIYDIAKKIGFRLYDGVGLCDICGHDISGIGDDSKHHITIKDLGYLETDIIYGRIICHRCNEVIQGFIASITKKQGGEYK